MRTTNHNYLIDALDVVLAWDLPEESLADALLSQAIGMSGIDSEYSLQDFTQSLH